MAEDVGTRPGLDALPTPPAASAGPSPRAPRIVGIGASVGGLAAFTEFLQHMPPTSGLAFVLVQHLDPEQPSLLPELLAAHTAMPVRPVVDQIPASANHVYLIPPSTTLTIAQGVLCLASPAEAHGHRLPIDHFFRSLAADQGAGAVGIVLSGTGADGAEGLAAIQARGGLTLAQTPATALAPAMPQTAIARGAVDHVLAIAAMPELLVAAASEPRGVPPPDAAFPTRPSRADSVGAIIAVLQDSTGHDFSHYKRATLLRRIERRMQLLRLASLEDYHEQLRQDQREAEQLFQDLLISVTGFFRDPEAFASLEASVIPPLLRRKAAGAPLRVWVPGCATGEEAYSLAILLHEHLARLATPPPVQIFASDIDEAALAVARRGVYDARIVDQVPPERLSRYFVEDGQGYQVAKPIREICLFSAHNLISDPPFGRMDLLACRNLLIYFDAELQSQLIPVFHYALAPGGYLFLGSAESATGATDATDLFRAIDGRHRIYQRKERLVHPQLALPWASAVRPLAHTSGPTPPGQATAPGDLGASVERALLQDYVPLAVLVDPQGALAYIRGRTYPYLSVPPGAPTASLFELAHPDLRLPLRTAIRAASQSLAPVVREDVPLALADIQLHLTLSVRPFPEAGPDAGLLLVVFQASRPPRPPGPPADAALARAAPPDALALELQRARDTLEATIGELQGANLDLTVANEELRSLNEELHAANEELQTSKEEIQSINEELQTVNAERSRKIEALDRANADLANLFAGTQVPAIFLQGDGRIARFTPQATELFALIDADVGRPLADLSPRFSGGDLASLIAQVQATLDPLESVIRQLEPDRWWAVRVRPYRTLAGTVDGVVLTFADITALKRAEAVLQGANDELERRVAARTSELAVSNGELKAQVAERMRAEQARQQLLQQLVAAQEEERRHIARELHDQLGQELAALILGLKALQESLPAGESTAARVAQLQSIAGQIGQEVRSLAVALRPSVLDDLGLALALSNYAELWSARAHVAVDLHTSGLDGERLPLAVETTIYRLVQEALTNVLKHAQASEVSIIVERQPAEVRVIIEDDGAGFVVSEPWAEPVGTLRLGLMGMRERVALLGGELAIESAPGSGTSIFARLPLPDNQNGGAP